MQLPAYQNEGVRDLGTATAFAWHGKKYLTEEELGCQELFNYKRPDILASNYTAPNSKWRRALKMFPLNLSNSVNRFKMPIYPLMIDFWDTCLLDILDSNWVQKHVLDICISYFQTPCSTSYYFIFLISF
jgi:hypothetical protein